MSKDVDLRDHRKGMDAIHVEVREGKVTNRAVYVAIGVSVNCERGIVGLWVGDGGKGGKFWLGADGNQEPERGRVPPWSRPAPST